MSIYSDVFFLYYCCIVAGIIGAVLGSFLNCAALRIAAGQSFVKGHSRCVSCGHDLGPLDLVPVFSWLFLGGKCRYCKSKVSPRYFIAEVAFMALTILCLLKCDISILFLRNMVLLCCLFCLSLVDMEICIIPDGCLITAAAAWIITAPFIMDTRQIFWHAAAALVYGAGIMAVSLVMDRILKKESLGGGDIKLFALMGLYLGFAATLFAVMLACIIGLIFALISSKRADKDRHFPFGPSIAAAMWIMLLYGQPFVSWYINISGLM